MSWNCTESPKITQIPLLVSPGIAEEPNLCGTHIPHWLCISETRSDENQMVRLARYLKLEKMKVVPANGSASGLAIFRNTDLDLQVMNNNRFLTHFIIKNHTSNFNWFLTLIQGPPYLADKKSIWDHLKKHLTSSNLDLLFWLAWFTAQSICKWLFGVNPIGLITYD